MAGLDQGIPTRAARPRPRVAAEVWILKGGTACPAPSPRRTAGISSSRSTAKPAPEDNVESPRRTARVRLSRGAPRRRLAGASAAHRGHAQPLLLVGRERGRRRRHRRARRARRRGPALVPAASRRPRGDRVAGRRRRERARPRRLPRADAEGRGKRRPHAPRPEPRRPAPSQRLGRREPPFLPLRSRGVAADPDARQRPLPTRPRGRVPLRGEREGVHEKAAAPSRGGARAPRRARSFRRPHRHGPRRLRVSLLGSRPDRRGGRPAPARPGALGEAARRHDRPHQGRARERALHGNGSRRPVRRHDREGDRVPPLPAHAHDGRRRFERPIRARYEGEPRRDRRRRRAVAGRRP